MVIIINVSNLRVGGGMQVAHSFINECIALTQWEYHVFLSREMEAIIIKEQFPSNFVFYSIKNRTATLRGRRKLPDELNALEKKINPAVVFSVFGPTYWKPASKHIAGFANSIYVYKDSPFFKRITLRQKFRIKIAEIVHMRSFRKHCDVLVTETEYMRKCLMKIFPGKETYTVGNTYHQVFNNTNLQTNEITLPDFDGFTLLTVSAMYIHKNLTIIPPTIDYLTEKYPEFKFRFILTIAKDQLGKLTELQMKHLVFVGKVGVSECPNLYAQSDAMFLPTLLETFTATYPEAMKMEKPILTSRLQFAISLCGNAAEYFDPLSPSDIGDAIYKLAYSPKRQEELIAKGKLKLSEYPSSSQRAEQYLEICKRYTNNVN